MPRPEYMGDVTFFSGNSLLCHYSGLKTLASYFPLHILPSPPPVILCPGFFIALSRGEQGGIRLSHLMLQLCLMMFHLYLQQNFLAQKNRTHNQRP